MGNVVTIFGSQRGKIYNSVHRNVGVNTRRKNIYTVWSHTISKRSLQKARWVKMAAHWSTGKIELGHQRTTVNKSKHILTLCHMEPTCLNLPKIFFGSFVRTKTTTLKNLFHRKAKYEICACYLSWKAPTRLAPCGLGLKHVWKRKHELIGLIARKIWLIYAQLYECKVLLDDMRMPKTQNRATKRE